MEVHHHPKVEKKNFKEYFLEFLMIFLVVTLGFFAENLREHFNDSHAIKNDMRSMIEDLQSDVHMYSSLLAVNELSDRRIDTLIKLLKTDRTNTSEIYFLARYITANNNIYTPNDKTFDQIKNPGALKLIESREILDSVSDYYQSLEFFTSQSNLQREKVVDVHLVNSQLFDGYTFQQMFSKVEGNISHDVDIIMPPNNPPLLTNNYSVINNIIVAYHYLYATTEVNNEGAKIRMQQAEHLIQLLKKEYKLT